MLRLPLGRLGPLHNNGFQGGLQQLGVGGVGSADASSKGSAVPLDQQAFLEQAFLEQAFLEQAFLEQAFLEQAFLEQAFLEQAFLDARLGTVGGVWADALVLCPFLPTHSSCAPFYRRRCQERPVLCLGTRRQPASASLRLADHHIW